VHDARAGFDTARSNRACDDGVEGPLTETQTDASRRTRLGARNGLQWAAHLDLLHILLLDRLDQLHSGSEPSLYSRASSTHEPPTRPTVGACPNWQRDAPPSCARLAACRAPCPASKAPPNQAGTPPPSGGTPHQWHRQPGQPSPSNRQGSTSTDLDAPSLRGHQRRAVGPCWARVRCPTRRPRRRPRQRADVGRGCSEPNPATRTSTESSLPVARALPAAGIRGAAKRTASLTSEPILGHSAAHTPRDSASGALAVAWIGCSQWHGSAAACSRLQRVPSAAGSLTGGTRLQHSACGWVGGGVGPGADVGGYEPSPVVSDELSPKTQMRPYRGEPCQSTHCAALHTHCAATDAAALQLPVERYSGLCIVAGCAAMQQIPLVRLGPLEGCSRATLGAL